MICDRCQGRGFVPHPAVAMAHFEDLPCVDQVLDVHIPCADCGGAGVVSCCDPARGVEADHFQPVPREGC